MFKLILVNFGGTKMKKILSLLTVVTITVVNLSVLDLQAGSGAGWGVAGGLIGASIIANAGSRNRDVVYVNNGPQGPNIVHDEDGRPMVWNGGRYVYIQ